MRLVHILRSVRQLNPARTSNIFFTNNQVTLEVIRQLILVVSLDSRTHGLHPHDNVHTSPTINSPMVLDCHRAGTTFFPPSMPVTGGSTNVIPLSFRRTSSPRGQWANLHLAMPCVSDYSVSVYCPRTFSLPGPLFFLDRDMAIAGWERSDPVTGACIKVEFGAISRANCLIDDSDDRIHWFSDYGSNWIEFVGTSGFHHLHRYLLMELNGYSWPVPGRVCADSASTGLVQDTGTSWPRMRPLSRVPSTKLVRRRSVIRARTVAPGLVDDHAFATWVAPSYYSRLFR